jgi:carboxyl-terminal processing protease
MVQVVAPTAGSPASRAGIRAQERLLAIDAVKTAGLNLYDVAARLQGPAGSTVVLTIQAKNGATRDVQLTRYDHS